MSINSAKIYSNLSREKLVSFSIAREECEIMNTGAVAVKTGKRTGRSPSDRFIVQDSITKSTINWGKVNQPIERTVAEALWNKALAFVEDKTVFVNDLQVGSDPRYAVRVKTINTLAWHSLFVKNLFIVPDQEIETAPQWTLLGVPDLKCNPKQDGVKSDGCVIIDFEQQRVLLVGMMYAGEMKKSFFTVLNFLMPQHHVLPMHCAANTSYDEKDVSLFFGLSGTGKTTLSADTSRKLIGDDEIGWTPTGVFNFEGGCYAKCISISKESEPLIWRAIQSNTVLENVVHHNGDVDFKDDSLTANTRAAYPREYIPNLVECNAGGTPKRVVFLTCDLFGVLPPVSRLSRQQAAYYFLSGYTALVGSTEVGSDSAIKPTFSACFGAAFFPCAAESYSELLLRYLESSNAQVYLINTGWHKGRYGQGGTRYPLRFTRTILEHLHGDDVDQVKWRKFPQFSFEIPETLGDYDAFDLNPIKQWSSEQAYWDSAAELIQAFQTNFKQFNAPDLALEGPCLDVEPII